MKRLTFNEICELKIGQVFYEEDCGALERFTVSKVPFVEVKSGEAEDWTELEWCGKKRDGTQVHFMIVKELSHYGPHIYVLSRKARKRP
jgi:hypothetical protein